MSYDGPGVWPAALAILGLLVVMIYLKFRGWVWGVCVAAVETTGKWQVSAVLSYRHVTCS